MPTITLPDGSVVQAQNVDFDVIDEPELEIETEDGTRLKARVVATNVLRIDAGDNPGGSEPGYSVNTEVHIRPVHIPESLMESDDDSRERGVE